MRLMPTRDVPTGHCCRFAARDIAGFVRAGCGLMGLLSVAACGAPAMIGPEPNEPGTEAQATGAEQHMAAAQREEVRLSKHRNLYDPSAKQSVRRCKPQQPDERGDLECWVETTNPTAIHQAEMMVHGERAAYHRRAARDLRAAETEACAGAAGNAREAGPFARGKIIGVSPLEELTGESRIKPQLVGATVFLQAIADVTVAQLQRGMDCYSAHQAVIGYGLITTETDRSPLQEPGSRATVREMSHGYAVDVRADDPFASQAIWLRAQRLAVVK